MDLDSPMSMGHTKNAGGSYQFIAWGLREKSLRVKV